MHSTVWYQDRCGGVDRVQVPHPHPAGPREPLHRDERRHVGRHQGRHRQHVRQGGRLEQQGRIHGRPAFPGQADMAGDQEQPDRA